MLNMGLVKEMGENPPFSDREFLTRGSTFGDSMFWGHVGLVAVLSCTALAGCCSPCSIVETALQWRVMNFNIITLRSSKNFIWGHQL